MIGLLSFIVYILDFSCVKRFYRYLEIIHFLIVPCGFCDLIGQSCQLRFHGAALIISGVMQRISWFLFLYFAIRGESSLISSSEIQYCRRSTQSFDPVLDTGDACDKKFIVSLAIRNGKVKAILFDDGLTFCLIGRVTKYLC